MSKPEFKLLFFFSTQIVQNGINRRKNDSVSNPKAYLSGFLAVKNSERKNEKRQRFYIRETEIKAYLTGIFSAET